MPHAEALAPALLERVLAKLGLSEPPSPTLEGLRTLYPAWCRTVPFDNIRQLIHRRSHDPSPMPGGDATEFFEAWLVYGTGGTCWSGNGALHALLLSLGFEATRGLCTMLVAPDIPPNHGSVLVMYEGSRYVVDASILHSEPLRLAPDAPRSSCIRPGACSAQSAMASGIFVGVPCLAPMALIAALKRCRSPAPPSASAMKPPGRGGPSTMSSISA
jgi:N-hydroxyarylamine O-acetyltransferase